MRLIDADALLDDVMERYCKDCDRRKGIKNGKWRIIYEIGEAPCRACSVDDMKCEIEDAPTEINLVRCKECRWHEREQPGMVYCPNIIGGWVEEEGYCYLAEREEE